MISAEEAAFYSRQAILPDFGLKAQQALRDASVVVVGAGGLGSACLQYLTGVGVGRILVVDFDTVDASNLHRQTIHGISSLNQDKVTSAINRCRDINPHVQLRGFPKPLTPELADELFPQGDVILDCCDNLPVRLCISDGAMHYKKPVVSGSALQFHGQMLIYGLTDQDSYRTLLGERALGSKLAPVFEEDMPQGEALRRLLVPFSGFSQSCAESGVLGPVPGLIGTLMALATVKLLTDAASRKDLEVNFTTYDFTNTARPFAFFKLRPKLDALEPSTSTHWRPEDYIYKCPSDLVPLLPDHLQVEWDQVLKLLECKESDARRLFIDVRPSSQSDMVSLSDAKENVCCPLSLLLSHIQDAAQCLQHDELMAPCLESSTLATMLKDCEEIFIYCRKGNASRVAVTRLKLLQRAIADTQRSSFLQSLNVKSVIGGLYKLKQNSPEWAAKLMLLP